MVRIALATISLFFAVFSASAQAPSSEDLERRTIERRAVEAVIWGMSAVNYDLMLQEMLNKTEAKVNEFVYWSQPLDWHNQTLTPNPDTLYFMAFFNTKEVGPLVLEIPPANGGSLNANIVTTWQMALGDGGLLGADKGKGGKYLILPPGYKDRVPEGYIPLHADTFGGYALVRSNLESHSDADVAKSVAYAKRVKFYPLSQAANPPETKFTDAQDVYFDSTIRYDASFFQNLDRIVQNEPWLDRDRNMIDKLKSLGIEKGKPFSPDAQTKELLDRAAREASAWLEAGYDVGFDPFWEGSRWTLPAPKELIAAQADGFSNPDSYPVDGRGIAYSYAYVGIKTLGAGQMYMITIRDKDGDAFDGSKSYRLHVPPDAPVEQYWSATAYDRKTHALIKNMNRASRASNSTEVQKNADGSVDVYFGPQAPADKEPNWVPTDPARQFEVMFRLYAPKPALFEKKWVLPDIEKMNE
ncbi:DUF1254 domain-containing protein [Sinorhizobium mexicanum]|uniref:DUF1254 domain-containing protein n=1 Tax=Sinorhizobium mexicanum TaxID=375549 RepID=A0A859QFA3_9HYPH|nr:DUF1254 domain-containing protein [Sinorhizobium mexicanum]MBP1882453.1 hypothetical protein [Sinorhizobium mexicanum]QLL62144.1 DUF1254 domain-containing protein [Sinorhizobium mexicanum]